MTVKSPDCMECKHFDKNIVSYFSCKAFPKGIPIEIIQGEIKHGEPIKGQKGGYVFEQANSLQT